MFWLLIRVYRMVISARHNMATHGWTIATCNKQRRGEQSRLQHWRENAYLLWSVVLWFVFIIFLNGLKSGVIYCYQGHWKHCPTVCTCRKQIISQADKSLCVPVWAHIQFMCVLGRAQSRQRADSGKQLQTQERGTKVIWFVVGGNCFFPDWSPCFMPQAVIGLFKGKYLNSVKGLVSWEVCQLNRRRECFAVCLHTMNPHIELSSYLWWQQPGFIGSSKRYSE